MKQDDELNQIFREEATEFIESLLDRVAELSTTRDDAFREILDGVLRTTHNLKGAASSTGATTVETLAHALEGMLSREKGTIGPLQKQVSECAIDALGIIQAAVDGVASDEQVLEMLDHLASLGGEVVSRPRNGEKSSVQDALEGSASRRIGAAGIIKVDTQRLDTLIGFTGEFLTFRSRLSNRFDLQMDVYKQLLALHKAQPDSHADLLPIISHLRRLLLHGRKDLLDFKNLIDEVSETAKQIRTVPLRGAGHIWRRVVREACQISDKDVRLEVSVGNVEIDRYVLERIQDPMMHLLRNAVDHGIESASERTALGKPPQGNVRVSASLQGAMIHLGIQDDGRGIDWERVRRKAEAKGLITGDQFNQMSAAQISDLLFLPGFSTADDVGRLSGRGVGLDVVRSQLEALGGYAEIKAGSREEGTTILLWVPVSILSSTGLFVRSGESVFVLPIESIVRTLRISRADLRTVDGRDMIRMEQSDPVRLIYLSDVMGTEKKRAGEHLNVAVLSRGTRQLGLAVDEVLGHREYISHRLPWNFEHVPGISGAIPEADGSVTATIDIAYLFDTSRHATTVQRMTPDRSRKVLVVDDSLSSRTLERAMLRADGYEVILAADGQEAWRILQKETFDLVVSDVQMPLMDGFELTRRIRAALDLKDLPVILVSNLSKSEDRAAGAEAGADDYLVKGTFDQQGLLRIVKKYLGKP